jgi:AraC-like DNA-binding protein
MNSVNYADGDMVVVDSLDAFRQMEQADGSMILSMIVVSGRLRLTFGGTPIEVGKSDILICPPRSVLADFHRSKNFHGLLFGMSYPKFQKTVGASGGRLWSVMMYAMEHPVFHMNEAEMSIASHFFYLFEEKLAGLRDYYYKEVMQSLMTAAFYEVSIIVERNMKYGRGALFQQKDLVFRRFLELLTVSEGRRGSVADYARQLCITPKYLSAAVKQASGKTAMAWIHGYMVDAISHELRFSDRSIKEISVGFGFNNLSTFGKFVREHIGQSPRAFRRGSAE